MAEFDIVHFPGGLLIGARRNAERERYYWRFFFLMIRRPPRSTQAFTPFPTRRSSDLGGRAADRAAARRGGAHARQQARAHRLVLRSEEHTSELQSRTLISYAVFCL